MIVTARTARAITAGRITQTRTPRLPGRACSLKAGHDYPLQVRRGRRLVGDERIEILAVGRELAGEITLAGAKAEGFRTTTEWKIQWVRRHDCAYRSQRRVNDWLWETGLVDDLLLDRFETRHVEAPVWAIAFKLTEPKRYLARPTRTSGDYVTHPGRAIDPVECIDVATQQRYATAAREAGEQRRASARRDLEPARPGNLSNRALRHVNGATQRYDVSARPPGFR